MYDINSICEKAVLAETPPIEEMKHAIVDILKSQEKVKLGGNFERA